MTTVIDIPVHLIGTVLLLSAVLVLRVLLDLEMGVWLIRLLNCVPTRAIFRHKFVTLRGDWEHVWGGETGRFYCEKDRHGHHYIFQLFRWVYADTRSQGRIFAVFGRIQGDFLIGRWYDNTDEAGYFGAFQMRIVDGSTLNGKWIGHSKTNPADIRVGTWTWTKNK